MVLESEPACRQAGPEGATEGRVTGRWAYLFYRPFGVYLYKWPCSGGLRPRPNAIAASRLESVSLSTRKPAPAPEGHAHGRILQCGVDVLGSGLGFVHGLRLGMPCLGSPTCLPAGRSPDRLFLVLHPSLASSLSRRCRAPRILSMIVFAGTLAKVFLVDMRNVEAIYRILSFMCLGTLLIAASWLYHRYFHRLLAP